MLKIKNKYLNLMVSFPVEIGELNVVCETQVWVYKNKDGTHTVDADFIDIEDITYMGIPINGYQNWNKFKAFHLEMGIDFDKIIHEKYRETVTKEAINELVKDLKF
jgi:hypothetical protein